MLKSMESFVSIHNRTNSDSKTLVLSVTNSGPPQGKTQAQGKQGKGQGKDRLHQLHPDAKLIAKAGPNSVHSTGFTFGQLKRMTKSRRLEVCKDLTCVACNTKGHISIDCPKVAGTKTVSHTQTGYKGTMQALLTTVNELKEQLSELTTRLASSRIHPDLDDGVSQWAFDTGLTDQALTPFLEDLQDPTPYRAGVDGAFAGEQSEMLGIVKGFTNLGHPIQFPALYVPSIRVRLVSRNTLRDAGLYMQDGPGGSFLTRPGDGEVAEIIDSPSGLMILSLSPQGPRAPTNIGAITTIVDSNDFSSFHADGQFDLANRTVMERELEKLHTALGHPSRQVMKRMLRKKQAYGIGSKALVRYLDALDPCTVCSSTRQRKTSKNDSTRAQLRRLQRIHVDLGFGPSQAPHKGSTTVAVIVDSSTSFVWVSLLPTKSQLADRVITLIETLRREFHHTPEDPIVTELRADQAKELKNNDFVADEQDNVEIDSTSEDEQEFASTTLTAKVLLDNLMKNINIVD
ncbi:hypothetical protein BC829DRAFT_420788 [Chytridium lagenaria]|nr:hypothetical protein BC829DRAFT_420788 [Chytridium lagenaria]